MNVLEKILEEIKEKCVELSKSHWGDDECHLVGKGIQSMYIQTEKIIRFHMDDVTDANDGWILCRDNMPTKDMDGQPVWIVYGSLGNLSTEFAYCNWVLSDDENGNDDSYSQFYIDQAPRIYYPSKNLVHAWKPVEIPEPYKPKKDLPVAGNEHIMSRFMKVK